jgi:hypothetical protein
VTKSAFIQILDPGRTEIRDITTSSPYIEAKRLDNTSQPGHEGEIEIQVTITPGLPPGRINETIVAQSNLTSKPEAKLRLSGIIVGDVEVTPDVLRFVYDESEGAQKQLPQQKLQIINRSTDISLRILKAQDLEDKLDLNLTTIEEGQRYELTATLRREALTTQGVISGALLITTNNPEQQEITVRYGVLRRK